MKSLAGIIKPIRTKKDYRKALEALDKHFDAKRGTKEGDLIEVLAVLIEKYEAENVPIEAPTPVEAIKFRMEQMGWEQKHLANLLGSRSRASELLAGSRPLSLKMIRLVHTEMGIPAESLIGTG